MRRLACAELPALPLQLARRLHPEWGAAPSAVVAEDKPQAALLWVDGAARTLGIRTGMRYAAALSLCGQLRAAPVPPEIVAAAIDEIATLLRGFSPHVEASPDPGTFWLDATGLAGLFRSPAEWARRIRAALEAAALESVVAVGFTRFGAWAVARALGVETGARREKVSPIVVFATPEAERAAARRVPLEALGLDADARDTLERLGVTTVAQLVALPAHGLAERFGAPVAALREAAAGRRAAAFDPSPALEPVEVAVDLEFPETAAGPVVALVEELLPDLLEQLARRGLDLAALTLHRTLDRGRGKRTDVLELAQPTRELVQVMDLVRLRLEASPLPAGVVALALACRGVYVAGEQRSLLAVRPHRDARAAERALARLRAELGADAVVRAAPRAGHLPEGQFSWQRLERLVTAHPPPGRRPALVRRLFDRPREIPAPVGREMPMWFLRGLAPGCLERADGPYAVEGGWWSGRAVQREYSFLHTATGQLLWVFHDRVRRRWYLQGLVE